MTYDREHSSPAIKITEEDATSTGGHPIVLVLNAVHDDDVHCLTAKITRRGRMELVLRTRTAIEHALESKPAHPTETWPSNVVELSGG
jgi:hypothetical protein